MRKRIVWWFGAVALAMGLTFWLSPTSQSQTVNMGRTYRGSQNVEFPNEAGTGTTLNKLAKLTGAPSTAIITATTDTSGIVGIVVGGAGTTGTAVIAFKGKASCDFDSATTAGHYVVNDTSTAGDCMDSGASTYPTSGQVIGVVTSTNGGAGTYEVDLTLGQAQAGGAGGGSVTVDSITSLPATCTTGSQYLPTDSPYSVTCSATNVWSFFFGSVGYCVQPPSAGWTAINGPTVTQSTDGIIYLLPPPNASLNWRLYTRNVAAAPYTLTAKILSRVVSYGNSAVLGIYLGDGTSYIGLELLSQASTASVRVQRITNVTTAGATPAISGDIRNIYSEAGFRSIVLRIQNDNTNHIYSYSLDDGGSFTTLLTEAKGAYITPTVFGIGGLSQVTGGISMRLISWQVN